MTPTVSDVTEQNFEMLVVRASVPVVVGFWAPSSVPSRALAPVMETIGEVFAGHLKAGKLNVDEYPVLAERYRVTSVPAVILFSDGEAVQRWVGPQSQARLVHELAMVVRGQRQAARS